MNELKKYWFILLAGLLLRIFLASFTFHPDLRNTSIVSTIILREGNLNPYDFAENLKDERRKIYSNETTDDLPLVYWINIPVQFLLRPFVNSQVEYTYLSKIEDAYGKPELFWYLFISKLPFILFDMALGVILLNLVAISQKRKILLFWMFNPFTLWATAAIGQFDIIPTFFMILSLLFLKREKPGWAAFSLGMAAAIKSFAFLIVPFLIFLPGSWKERIKIFLIFLIPWVFSVLPYLGSAGFRHNALFAPQLGKILYSKIPLSGGESVFLVPSLLVMLYLVYLMKKRTAEDFLAFSLGGLLLTLAFTHFHIQWFLWVLPLLSLIFINSNNARISIGLLGFSLVLMLFLFESSLQVKLFAPLFPVLNNASGVAELLGPDKASFLRNIAATIFAGSSIFLSFLAISGKEKNE